MKLNKKTYLREELEQSSSRELETLLQQELQAETPDGEKIRELLKILEERHHQNPDQITISGADAWEKYKLGKTANKKGQNRHNRFGLRIAAALAVVFTVAALALPQFASAENWLELIARWSDDFIEFFSTGNEKQEEYVFKTDNPGLQQIYDAVTEMGVTEPVVPMWIEDGYELMEIKETTTPGKQKIYARLNYGKNEAVLVVTLYFDEAMNQVHKGEDEPKTYEINGIIHYISQNGEKQVAVWAREKISCTLSVGCQEDTFYRILDSIYTAEEN